MKELADSLRDVLRLRGSVEKFVLTILKASRIYREPQMIHIQNVLEHLKNQRDIERQKYKGDNLLESGEIEEAILVYQSILNQEKDESVVKSSTARSMQGSALPTDAFSFIRNRPACTTELIRSARTRRF